MTITYVDDKNFDREVATFQHPKIVVFSADWCPHCHRMMPVLEEVAKRYNGKAKMFLVNVTQSPKAAAKYSVRGVPTMLFFRDGKHFSQLVGEAPITSIEDNIKAIL
ncbi:MAG: thioredoxin [Elusimicrobiaceae bacterium]|nr:thioredoxin [Elusimicrobiaceae bacterium]